MGNIMRLVVATPSVVDRSRLARALGQSARIDIIAQPSDLSETYTICEAQEPDVVLLAESYAASDEFDCMKSLFSAVGAHWIVIGDPARRTRSAVGSAPGAESLILASMSGAELISEIERIVQLRGQPTRRERVAPPAQALARPRTDRLILIGASTGGVDALLNVLSALPANAPPVAVVQHTGQGFSDSLIRLLDRRATVEVQGAVDGLILAPGRVCVAAGTAGHLRIGGHPERMLRAVIAPGPPVSGHTPSVDELFHSAVSFATKVVAVLLTGMGRDGAAGMLALRRAGAETIAQDEASSVVYGMPRAAWESGAAASRLSLNEIAPALLRLCSHDPEHRAMHR
jgi:two-component system chemotaxis response regulator CheB